MLGSILRLFRPSYALTALLLFVGWQGYSYVKTIPEKLSILGGAGQSRDSESSNVEPAGSEQEDSSRFVRTVRSIHPGMRILYWLVSYALVCLASVPLIKKTLARESNLANAALVVVYSSLGLLSAFGFVGFQFGWLSAIMLIAALLLSAGMIVWLAGELEKLRVQDT